MKKNVLCLVVSGLLFFLFLASNCPAGEIKVSFSTGTEGVNSYYYALGDYYRVPQRDIMMMKQRSILDTQIPVVLFIASKANVSADLIVKMRLRGMSWMNIAKKFDIGPEAFYVPAGMVWRGTMYERSYGYFNAPKSRWKWKRMKLSDADIVNFVNLRFMSDYYGYRPDEVIRMKFASRDFIYINSRVREQRIREKGRGHGTYNNGMEHNDKNWDNNNWKGRDHNKWDNGGNRDNQGNNNGSAGGNNQWNNNGRNDNRDNGKSNNININLVSPHLAPPGSNNNNNNAAPAGNNVNNSGNNNAAVNNNTAPAGNNINNSGNNNAAVDTHTAPSGNNRGVNPHNTPSGNNTGNNVNNTDIKTDATPAAGSTDSSGNGDKANRGNNGRNSAGDGAHTDNGNNKDNGAGISK